MKTLVRQAIAAMAVCFAVGGCASDDSSDDSADGGDGADDGSGDGDGDGDGDGGGLSSECTALCGHTETASDLQAQCVPIVLSDLGGYLFTETSCTDLSAAYNAGVATSAMCVQCYLDASVQADHCQTAESMCF